MDAQGVAADHGETGMGRVDQHSGQGRGVARRNLDDEPRRLGCLAESLRLQAALGELPGLSVRPRTVRRCQGRRQ